MLEKLFKLKENHTNVRTEVLAGITTFMTMAYILAVNPNMLQAAGMDPTAVLIATCLASCIGTFAMALLANYPFALAPGMGLNAYFAFTVCGAMGYSWKVALMAVFIEGIIFIILSLTNVREAIFNAIPLTLKKGVGAGIGLFIAFIGLQGGHIVGIRKFVSLIRNSRIENKVYILVNQPCNMPVGKLCRIAFRLTGDRVDSQLIDFSCGLRG